MADWHERIRKAFLDKEAAEKIRAERERDGILNERRRKIGAEEKRQQERQASLDFLKNVGAYDLLDRTKKDIWKSGNISIEESGYAIVLERSRRHRRGNSGYITDSGVYVPPLKSFDIGMMRERLAIINGIGRLKIEEKLGQFGVNYNVFWVEPDWHWDDPKIYREHYIDVKK